MAGIPFVAGTHGPVAGFVVVCNVKFVPAEAGQKTMICPPPVPTVNGGMLTLLVLTTLSERGWLTTAPRLSAAWTVKLKRPLVASVPERKPFVPRFKFAGRLPDDNHQL